MLALGDYRQPELRAWVLALKHGGRTDLAGPLARALARRVGGGVVPASAWLVPIPLHAARRWERGYDQAQLLARALSAELDVGAEPVLSRSRSTAPQGAPGAKSRAANVRDAFAVEPDLRRRLAGRDVWLVDDVSTSGATLDEAARVLRRAGARRVDALVLASARTDG